MAISRGTIDGEKVSIKYYYSLLFLAGFFFSIIHNFFNGTSARTLAFQLIQCFVSNVRGFVLMNNEHFYGFKK